MRSAPTTPPSVAPTSTGRLKRRSPQRARLSPTRATAFYMAGRAWKIPTYRSLSRGRRAFSSRCAYLHRLRCPSRTVAPGSVTCAARLIRPLFTIYTCYACLRRPSTLSRTVHATGGRGNLRRGGETRTHARPERNAGRKNPRLRRSRRRPVARKTRTRTCRCRRSRS